MQKKEYAQVEQVLGTALKLRPHYGKAYFNLGRLYMELGDKNKAYEAFKNSCTKADFDNETGFGTYAAVCMQLGKHDEAIFGYTKALECKPGVYDHMFNLANAYFLQKEYAKAQQLYKQLCQMNPKDTRVVFNIAETHMALKDFASALAQYQLVRNMDPSSAASVFRSAECYKLLGNKEQARILFNDLLAGQVPEELKKRVRGMLVQLG
jgi:tetratricopeptide (TPR) repeat protein